MTIKKILVGLFATLGVVYALMMLYAFVFVDCRYTPRGLTSSPDGKYLAEYFVEECEELPPIIKVIVGEQKSGSQMVVFSAVATTTEIISLVWKSDNELLIKYPSSLNPTTARRSKDYINIEYQESANNGT